MAGNDRRTRGSTTRHGGSASRTRESRERLLPTNPGTAARLRSVGVTREYQRDSSSKRPASRHLQPPLQRTPTLNPRELDERSFYISGPGVDHGQRSGLRRERLRRRTAGRQSGSAAATSRHFIHRPRFLKPSPPFGCCSNAARGIAGIASTRAHLGKPQGRKAPGLRLTSADKTAGLPKGVTRQGPITRLGQRRPQRRRSWSIRRHGSSADSWRSFWSRA